LIEEFQSTGVLKLELLKDVIVWITFKSVQKIYEHTDHAASSNKNG
jgi:hypothetical protein